MDTLKILLAATVALLIGALAVAYKDGGPEKDTSKSEIAELKLEFEKLRMERDTLEQQRKLQALQDAAAKAPVYQAPAPAPSAAENAALQDQIAKLEEEKAKAERNAETANNEAAFVGGQVLEHRDGELRRARMIKDALPMARIKEWVDDPQAGSFGVIEVLQEASVQQESVLCVRRNTGILGKVKITSVSIEGAIANAVSSFPGLKPQAGDDLILDPME
ncbi:hypothetical protein [Luteolibacter sp. Populi]|uniref:hypothetical protein n=1 Tax=Luteolibacter sp. Populi TaxID=3230487 RepID=UPI0034672A6A